MKRASRRNLDGDLSGLKPAGEALRTVSTSSLSIGPFQSGMEQASAVTAINDLSNLSCASKLKKIGFMLGDDEFAVNRSINGLKKWNWIGRLLIHTLLLNHPAWKRAIQVTLAR